MSKRPSRPRRATPLRVRGEPLVWLTGGSLFVCLLLIFGLIGLTVYKGSVTFWPRPIDTVTLSSGEVFVGIAVEEETLRSGGDEEGARARRLYRVGNKGSQPAPFRWVFLDDVTSIERRSDSVMIERYEWGVWFGSFERAMQAGDATAPPPDDVRDWSSLRSAVKDAKERRRAIQKLRTSRVDRIQSALERERLGLKNAEIRVARASEERSRAPMWLWIATLVGGIAGLAGFVAPLSRGRLFRPVLLFLGLAFFLFAWLEAPQFGAAPGAADLEAARASHDARVSALTAEYEEIRVRIDELERADAVHRLVVRDPYSGRFAPQTPTDPDEPMHTSQVVRVVRANELSLFGKIGVYLSRWHEFLTAQPRQANSEGGVFPVIFGTVMLTILLSGAVMPLGVVAALYMREYAKQGVIISLVRIAVNNLAGVPSIVYGVFGLGFFCYTLGHFIDVGPKARLPVVWFWVGIGLLVAILGGAIGATRVGRKPEYAASRLLLMGGVMWAGAVALALGLVATTPYFTGFFEARLPQQTFGTRGMLWASLTLALLTLPVVIVATEEALSAVPSSLREGSYACGASKWQTVQRIVLPRALPGMMTGMILAMARGAGEVAPMMLVGAVKHAQKLPVSGTFPYLHLDRSFMHLGFHIYDVGFKSSNSEAARPLVWTTTLLLLSVVLALNLAAIRLRAVLRRRFVGGAF